MRDGFYLLKCEGAKTAVFNTQHHPKDNQNLPLKKTPIPYHPDYWYSIGKGNAVGGISHRKFLLIYPFSEKR